MERIAIRQGEMTEIISGVSIVNYHMQTTRDAVTDQARRCLTLLVMS